VQKAVQFFYVRGGELKYRVYKMRRQLNFPFQWQKFTFSPMMKLRFLTVEEFKKTAGVSESGPIRGAATHPHLNSWKIGVQFKA